MPESVMEPLRDVLFSGYTGEGRRVEQFERELAMWFGNPNVLTVNTGTSALHLALRLAGVGAGDEVVSTPMTCIATNSPILALGAHVVWADIDPWTGNISPADLARKITPRTKAIIAVHWGGYPCDLRGLAAVAEAHAVPLVEDACHATLSPRCASRLMQSTGSRWTHYYDETSTNDRIKPELFQKMSGMKLDGFECDLFRLEYDTYLKNVRYRGGVDDHANWMRKPDLLACLEHFGLGEIQIAFDQTEHLYGPNLALFARRTATHS